MEFKPLTVKQYLALDFPENDIIGSGILTKQSVLIIGGHPGVGKSVLAQQIGIETSEGLKVLDIFKSKRSRVLYLQEEIGPKSYQIRLEKAMSHYHSADSFFVISSVSFSFDDPIQLLKLKAFIAKLRVDIAIFDPLYKLHSRQENDPTEMTQLIQLISRLINELGISVILIHHLKKPFMTYKGDVVSMGMMDFRGATVIPAWADTMMLLEETTIKDKVRLSFPKLRNAPEDVPSVFLTFDRAHLRFAPVSNGSQPISIRDDAVNVLLANNGGISEGNIVNQLKAKYGQAVDSSKIRAELKSLRRSGTVELTGGLLRVVLKVKPDDDPWSTQD